MGEIIAFDYVDGTLDNVNQGNFIEFEDMGSHIRVSKNPNLEENRRTTLEIPKENIVELQHYTVTPSKKKTNKGLYALGGALILGGLMFTPLGPAIAGAKLMSLGLAASKFAGAFAVGGAVYGVVGGAYVDVMNSIAKKAKQKNIFMISYLDEGDPENLKVIVLEHGEKRVSIPIHVFNRIIEKSNDSPKADFVVKFLEKLEANS